MASERLHQNVESLTNHPKEGVAMKMKQLSYVTVVFFVMVATGMFSLHFFGCGGESGGNQSSGIERFKSPLIGLHRTTQSDGAT